MSQLRRWTVNEMSSKTVFYISVVAALTLSTIAVSLLKAAENCSSLDQPNPIATTYPNNATGVFNATLAILPIALSTARQIIPAQWAILEGAYRELLPDFPAGMYPLFLQAGHDHDVQFAAFDLSIPDFSVCLTHPNVATHA
jgi:hypothetical protein